MPHIDHGGAGAQAQLVVPVVETLEIEAPGEYVPGILAASDALRPDVFGEVTVGETVAPRETADIEAAHHRRQRPERRVCLRLGIRLARKRGTRHLHLPGRHQRRTGSTAGPHRACHQRVGEAGNCRGKPVHIHEQLFVAHPVEPGLEAVPLPVQGQMPLPADEVLPNLLW